MNEFLLRNKDNFLIGTVTSAGKVNVGLLVCLKSCCLSPGPGVGARCGDAHVHLRPGSNLPKVGERIACSGRLVNATNVGTLMRDAIWEPAEERNRPERRIERQMGKHVAKKLQNKSEMAFEHLQVAAGIMTGLSHVLCDNEQMGLCLEGLRQTAEAACLWPKDFLATEYEADAYEKALNHLFRRLADAAELADRQIAELRTPFQMLQATQIIGIRDRIEAALFTLARMNESRMIARDELF